MAPMRDDLLKDLQAWYLAQCDGRWEHSYGIKMETIDNPGWSFKVDLAATPLFDRAFDEMHFDGPNENDWYVCRIRNHIFEGICGPNRLSEVVAAFLNWAAVR